MRSILFLLAVILACASNGYAQCPGGVCPRPTPSVSTQSAPVVGYTPMTYYSILPPQTYNVPIYATLPYQKPILTRYKVKRVYR